MTGGDKPDVNKIGQLAASSLARRASAAHLDAESLASFAANALGSDERERALAHLAECSDCREVVFLAQPQMAEEQGLPMPSRPRGAVAFRWAAFACAFAIVAGGAFLAKHELSHQQQLSARQEPATQMYTRTADEQPSQPQPSSTPGTARLQRRAEIQANGRPEPKHMTAKPKEKMQFDSSDQVRISNASASPATVQAQGQNEIGLRNLAATAPSAMTTVEANKIQPRSTQQVAAEAETVTVDVTGANPPINAKTGALVQKMAPAPQSRNGAVAGMFYTTSALGPVAQWTLSPAGALQRSLDQGKTWQEVPVNGAHAGFLATYSSGVQVWVGGRAGSLYHSADSGLIWTRVTPASGERKLNSDIVHIEFADAQNGRVNAASGESWTTTDGGQTWTPQN